jgi:uncharacterized paraquat-inducible protein A
MSLGKKELQKKIAGAKRVRRLAFAGLAVGVTVFMVGLVVQVSILFLVGYTVFIVCTGISSFTTVLNWQYNKVLKAQIENREKSPLEIVCPRCGTHVDKSEKYCPKCGKKIQTRKS